MPDQGVIRSNVPRWRANQDLATKIRQLERNYDQRFKLVFDTIQQLIKREKQARPIGFEIGRARKKPKE